MTFHHCIKYQSHATKCSNYKACCNVTLDACGFKQGYTKAAQHRKPLSSQSGQNVKKTLKFHFRSFISFLEFIEGPKKLKGFKNILLISSLSMLKIKFLRIDIFFEFKKRPSLKIFLFFTLRLV